MSKKIRNKLVVSFIAVFLVVMLLIPFVSTTAHAAGSNIMGSYERDAQEQAEYDKMIKRYQNKEDWYLWSQEEKANSKTPKGKMERRIAEIKLLNQKVPEIAAFIKDIENGGDFDTAALLTNIFSTASGVASFIPPYGPIIGAGIDLVSSVFTAIMGGEEAPSATALLEDNMNQKFDEISRQIAELENQIGDLSNQVNENTEKIIQEMEHAFDVVEAKNAVNDFYLSTGKDDFGYNKYKNYIYGTTKDNSSATTAYYNLLLHAQFSNASDEEVKYYYDMLYSSLMDNRDDFKNLVVGSGTGKSIVQYYYDILDAHPEFVEVTPELAALQFAYDLYQTQVLSDELMLVCNNYQYTQMLLNCRCKEEGRDICECYYDYGDGKVWRSQIEGDDTADSIYAQIIIRENEFTDQIAKDIAYALNLDGSYAIKFDNEQGDNGEIYLLDTEEKEGIIYGKADVGSIVYLNTIPTNICELFGIDENDYAYTSTDNNILNEDGIFMMGPASSIVSLTYKGRNVNSICFENTSSAFDGGEGTIDNPYLISTAEQLKKINHGMDKYYRLTKNIDFSREDSFDSLGKTKVGDFIEYEPFNGILDGNGHSISNITIIGDDYAGLFGRIGEDGIVKNLSLNCVKIRTTGYSCAKESSYSNYIGIIAGENQGIIRNCQIYSTNIKNDVEIFNDVEIISETSNEGVNRCVYFYVGGVAGKNNGIIEFVSMSQTSINVESTHNFHGASTSENKNIVYVGGVSGYNLGNIKCAIINDNTNITAKAKSLYAPKTTVNPYVTALAGGITGKNHDDSLSQIKNVYSAAVTSASGLLKIVDQDSRWWECYGNRIQAENAYVPNCVQNAIDKIITDPETIRNSFPQNERNTFVVNDTTDNYNVGDKSLNFENINVKLNDVTVEYKVLDIYGFNTTKESNNQEVTMFIVVNPDTNPQLALVKFAVKVVDNVIGIGVSGFKTEYEIGEEISDVMTVFNYYASGDVDTVENVQVSIENIDLLTTTNGKKVVTISYNGIPCEVEIIVYCDHEPYFVPKYNETDGKYIYENIHKDCSNYLNIDLYEFIRSVNFNCQKTEEDKKMFPTVGFDEYRCLKCDKNIYTNFREILDHDYKHMVGTEPTCEIEGISSGLECKICNYSYETQEKLPMEPHDIVEWNSKEYRLLDIIDKETKYEDEHYCLRNKHWTPHEFLISKVQNDKGEVFYEYVCESCHYFKEVKANIVTSVANLQPIFFVSDGFALNGGDLVTIYVQLENNPGITTANFGIRWDKELTLVNDYDMGLFERISKYSKDPGVLTHKNYVSNGIDFYWMCKSARPELENGDVIKPNGNMVKLVFKLPENATRDKVYNISIIYNEDENDGLENGVVLDSIIADMCGIDKNNPTYFLVRNGSIRVVDRLPGDIDGNKIVDVLDMLYIIKAEEIKETNKELYEKILKYGNVDFTGGVSPTDATRLLNSLFGGHGENGNLLTYKYQIELNTNGYKIYLGNVAVDVSEQITYGDILEIYETIMNTREGYKFLGWFTELVDGEHKTLDKRVEYNHNQKIQTLYAHWEKNALTFIHDGDQPVSIGKDGIIPAPIQIKKVVLMDAMGNEYGEGRFVRAFVGWSDGKGNILYRENDSIDIDKPGLGNIELTAVWGEWSFEIVMLADKHGYDNTKESIIWYTTTLANNLYDEYELNMDNYLNCHKNELPTNLYGKWIPLEYSISYDLDGGEFSSSYSSSVKYNEEFVVNFPIRIGYTFSGWTISNMDGETHYRWDANNTKNSDESFSWSNIKDVRFKNLRSDTGTVKFTAQWQPNTYTITFDKVTKEYFDPNQQSPIPVEYGSQFTVELPSKTGYTFAGWTITGMDSYEHTIGTKITNVSFIEDIYDTIFKNLHSTSGQIVFTANWIASFEYTFDDENKTCVVTGIGGFENAKNIVIPEYYSEYKVIEIGNSAFFGRTNLETVIIPATVTRIEDSAFFGCTKLDNVYIPSSVTKIGDSVFWNCTNLETLTISTSVTEIGDNAFRNCSNLKTIKIPSSVTRIGFSAFQDCKNLISISLPFVGNDVNSVENTHFSYIFGAKTYTEGDDFVPNNLSEIEITGGDEISKSAFFGCSNLKKLTIPFVGANANSISPSESTFFGYIFGDESYEGGAPTAQIISSTDDIFRQYYIPYTLEEVIICGGKIHNGAFYNCNFIRVINMLEGVDLIGHRAFSGCEKLEKIYIPNSITKIESESLRWCPSLREISIPFIGDTIDNNNNYHIGYLFGNETASAPKNLSKITFTGKCVLKANYFTNCFYIEEIEISKNVVDIEDNAFKSCYKLVHIRNLSNKNIIGLPNNIGQEILTNEVDCFNNQLYIDEYGLKIFIVGNNRYLFSYSNWDTVNVDLSSIDTVNGIYPYAFYKDEHFESIILPNTIKYIGEGAFSNCLYLLNIGLPTQLETIEKDAFKGCVSLESIIIPKTVSKIIDNPFIDCLISAITVENGNAVYHSQGNCLIETNSKILIVGSLKSVIPTDGSVTTIGPSAFARSWIETITIPSTVTRIEKEAFWNTYALQGIDLPSSVEYIGDYAFYTLDSFTKVIIRNKTCEIGENSFFSNVSIQGVSNDDTCTAYVYAKENGNSYSTITCFTGDMKVMLADGTYARIDSLKQGDIIMSWNAFTGELEAMPISLFWNHGEATYDVIKLYFDNNTIVKIIAEHGFFDATLNKYVYINQENYVDYIGHEFAVVNDKDALENVLLINVEINNEECSSYSLRTACNDNAIVEGLLTLTFEDIKGFLTYFEFGENYMYDKEKLQADIEKYGLYTYDDWKEYVSYEEFVALNGQYLKIVIGKGYLSYEDILKLISGMRV